MKTNATRYFECGSVGGSVEYWNNMHISCTVVHIHFFFKVGQTKIAKGKEE
jgi:hypothetical protein